MTQRRQDVAREAGGLRMKKIYRGWWIALTCTLLMAFAMAPGMNLTGVFIKPLEAEFGVPRTAITLQNTIYTITGMISSLFVGGFLRKLNIKKMMAISISVLGITYLLRGFCGAIWQLYILSAISGFFIMLVAQVPVSFLINNWFGSRMRGRVLGVVMAGTGIGATLLSPILSYINETVGWRTSFFLMGVIMLVVLLPLILLVVVATPAELGLVRIGDDDMDMRRESQGLMLKQALRTKSFWLMAVVVFLFAVNGSTVTSNQLAYFTDIGLPVMQAAAYASVGSIILIVGKIMLGVLCDKLGVRKTALYFTSVEILGMALLLCSSKITGLALPALIFFSVGTSVPTVCNPLMIEEIFGNRDFGSVFAIISIFANLGIGLGPLFGTIIFDLTQTYALAWACTTVFAVVLVLSIWLAYRNRPSLEQAEDGAKSAKKEG